ncbi:MAG: FeoA family protein [Sphaerochaeta sp.]
MPLSYVNPGETKQVVSFSAGNKYKDRFMSMGIVPGRNIKIVDITNAGLIIEVQNTRFALNKGLAHLIQVI